MNIGSTVECVNPIQGLPRGLYVVLEIIDKDVVWVDSIKGEKFGYYSISRFKEVSNVKSTTVSKDRLCTDSKEDGDTTSDSHSSIECNI